MAEVSDFVNFDPFFKEEFLKYLTRSDGIIKSKEILRKFYISSSFEERKDFLKVQVLVHEELETIFKVLFV